MLAGNSYPAYKEWALNLLLKWAEQDPVSEKEINRNTAAYGVQKNRNPFVDYPGLERYIWGDMQNVPFSYDNYQNPTSIITINAPTTPRRTQQGHLHRKRKEVRCAVTVKSKKVKAAAGNETFLAAAFSYIF